MVEQGYDMEPSLLYQDNMSAILLETNGRASSSKRTKHIKVKYCFVKDKVDQGELTIKHCQTEQMWTDINTKPKQEAVFRAFRGYVMGIPADYNEDFFASSCNFRPPTEPVSMLPIPKDQVATHECVEKMQLTRKACTSMRGCYHPFPKNNNNNKQLMQHEEWPQQWHLVRV